MDARSNGFESAPSREGSLPLSSSGLGAAKGEPVGWAGDEVEGRRGSQDCWEMESERGMTGLVC